MAATVFELLVAGDIGNNGAKVIINDELRKQPSVIKRLYTVPNEDETSLDKLVAKLDDEMLLNITSEALERGGLFVTGSRAQRIGIGSENMNITLGGKYKSDIPVIMTLAEITDYVIKQYYSKNKALPDGAIIANVKHSGAIPASEYTRDRAGILENRFKDKTHNLSVYVGNKQVSIQVKIEDSHVTQEGIPLLYALVEADPSMFTQFNSDYKLKINPKQYFLDKRIFHIDIGDGTTEEIVTQGLNPVAGAGVRLGGGHAIQAAALMLEKHTDGFVRYNRQQFQDAVKDKSNVHHEKCVNYLAETRYEQAHQIFEDVQEKFMSIAQGNVDLFTVYGGGSIEFEEDLRAKLKSFAEQVGAKLLWIPEEYAIDLQAKGLNILNKNVFYKGDK